MLNKTVHSVSRICCVCRKLQPTADMMRVVRVDNQFFVQSEQHLNGRGAHVCAQCLTSQNLSKCLARSFKTTLPYNIIEELSQVSEK